jgi:hypothetical protein
LLVLPLFTRRSRFFFSLGGLGNKTLNGYQGFIVKVKWTENEVDCLFLASAKVKNEWSYRSSTSVCSHVGDEHMLPLYSSSLQISDWMHAAHYRYYKYRNLRLDIWTTTTTTVVIENAQTYLVRYTGGAGLLKDRPMGWKGILKWILDKWCMKIKSVSINFIGFSIRVITPLMTEDTLRMIYHAYIHSIITYGIIFWGNSPHSDCIFKMQKRIIRIITKSRGKDSCRQLFKRLEILPLKSQYILSVLLFVVKKQRLIYNKH